MSKCACFVAGTLVLTEKGLVPIEQITPGDKVWSENAHTGESEYKSVVKKFVNQADTLVKLSFALVDVLDVETVYPDTPIFVYNFEVADWHTCFVGNLSILVHNMCAKELIKSPKNAKQVLKYLKEQGCKVVSQNGSHVKLMDGIKTVIVPDHGAKGVAIETLKSIMKQAGVL